MTFALPMDAGITIYYSFHNAENLGTEEISHIGILSTRLQICTIVQKSEYTLKPFR